MASRIVKTEYEYQPWGSWSVKQRYTDGRVQHVRTRKGRQIHTYSDGRVERQKGWGTYTQTKMVFPEGYGKRPHEKAKAGTEHVSKIPAGKEVGIEGGAVVQPKAEVGVTPAPVPPPTPLQLPVQRVNPPFKQPGLTTEQLKQLVQTVYLPLEFRKAIELKLKQTEEQTKFSKEEFEDYLQDAYGEFRQKDREISKQISEVTTILKGLTPEQSMEIVQVTKPSGEVELLPYGFALNLQKKELEDISQKIQIGQISVLQDIEKVSKWHYKTTVEKTDEGFSVDFPCVGAENWQYYKSQFQSNDILKSIGLAFATAFTGQDPLGIKSAWEGGAGDLIKGVATLDPKKVIRGLMPTEETKMKGIEVKVQALATIDAIKQEPDFFARTVKAVQWWAGMPTTQILLAGSVGEVLGAVLTGAKIGSTLAFKAVTAGTGVTLLTYQGTQIIDDVMAGREGEALAKATVTGLSIGAAAAGFKHGKDVTAPKLEGYLNKKFDMVKTRVVDPITGKTTVVKVPRETVIDLFPYKKPVMTDIIGLQKTASGELLGVSRYGYRRIVIGQFKPGKLGMTSNKGYQPISQSSYVRGGQFTGGKLTNYETFPFGKISKMVSIKGVTDVKGIFKPKIKAIFFERGGSLYVKKVKSDFYSGGYTTRVFPLREFPVPQSMLSDLTSGIKFQPLITGLMPPPVITLPDFGKDIEPDLKFVQENKVGKLPGKIPSIINAQDFIRDVGRKNRTDTETSSITDLTKIYDFPQPPPPPPPVTFDFPQPPKEPKSFKFTFPGFLPGGAGGKRGGMSSFPSGGFYKKYRERKFKVGFIIPKLKIGGKKL